MLYQYFNWLLMTIKGQHFSGQKAKKHYQKKPLEKPKSIKKN